MKTLPEACGVPMCPDSLAVNKFLEKYGWEELDLKRRRKKVEMKKKISKQNKNRAV